MISTSIQQLARYRRIDMSSLIFYVDNKQVLVATDTLVVDASTTKPIRFSSKSLYIPHLRMIVASTGVASFADHWATAVNHNFLADDIDDLVSITEEQMFNLFMQFKSLNQIDRDYTVTIYHFGFSKKSNEMKAYAHRSTNDFVVEPVEYGLGLKPICEFPKNTDDLVGKC